MLVMPLLSHNLFPVHLGHLTEGQVGVRSTLFLELLGGAQSKSYVSVKAHTSKKPEALERVLQKMSEEGLRFNTIRYIMEGLKTFR